MSLEMMTQFLDAHRVDYRKVRPPTSADFSYDLPARQQRELVQTILVQIDGGLAMLVIPADHAPRLDALAWTVDAESIALPDSAQVRDAFPDCQEDSIPPFGMLCGMRVFLTDSLRRSDTLAFRAGSEENIVEISCDDFTRLVVPIFGPFSASSRSARVVDRELAPAAAD